MDRNSVEKTETGNVKMITEQRFQEIDLCEPKVENFDKTGFAELIREIKGGRSARELALASDLSESFVNKAAAGFIERPPARRTMLKLLSISTLTPDVRRKLLKNAGYPEDQIDWKNPNWQTEEQQPVSAVEAINRVYGGNHYLAMGRLMSSLAQHGVKGDMSAYMYREAGYFEVRDESSGQVYVGINTYSNAGDDNENAVLSMVFSLALTYSAICQTADVDKKIVCILTNQAEIFESCQTFGVSTEPKATLVLQTDNFKGFSREKVLQGECPISLLDEIPE